MDTVVMCFVYKSLIKFSFLKNKCEFIAMCVSVCVGHVSLFFHQKGIRTQLVLLFLETNQLLWIEDLKNKTEYHWI